MDRPPELATWFALFEDNPEHGPVGILDFHMYAYVTWLEAKLEQVGEWTEQDVRRAAWEDDEDVITINGKPVGPTFGRREAHHRAAALQCARREVRAILNEEDGDG